jgi:hypothetical protein
VPSTNFLQVNPACNNQESDAAYASDTQRSGGMVSGVFASLLANKIFYQSSTFYTALAEALVAKGYSPNDGSAAPGTALVNLTTVLSNILTEADLTTVFARLITSFSIANGQGYVKFTSVFGGLTLQWFSPSSLAPGSHTIGYPIAFATSDPVIVATPTTGGNAVTNYFVTTNTLSNFDLTFSSSGNASFFCIAIGN